MANELKDLVRPPFANYDVVVYFGCGLFALPFILHYVPAPKFGAFLKLGLDTGVEFADAAVGTLFLLFVVYIVGHTDSVGIITSVEADQIERTLSTNYRRLGDTLRNLVRAL